MLLQKVFGSVGSSQLPFFACQIQIVQIESLFSILCHSWSVSVYFSHRCLVPTFLFCWQNHISNNKSHRIFASLLFHASASLSALTFEPFEFSTSFSTSFSRSPILIFKGEILLFHHFPMVKTVVFPTVFPTPRSVSRRRFGRRFQRFQVFRGSREVTGISALTLEQLDWEQPPEVIYG